MDELWTWLYTDELGKRRIYPGRLSEDEAKRLKDATRPRLDRPATSRQVKELPRRVLRTF
jgi:hypothetical protein